MDKLRRVAAHYQQAHDDMPDSWRIDVVAIELDRRNQPLRVEHIENAVAEM
jgi:Holliday junction resolvase-like predicted endonuclease